MDTVRLYWRYTLRFLECVSAIAALRQASKLYILGNHFAAYYALLCGVLFGVLAFSRMRNR